MVGLRQRVLAPELMDQPGLDPALLRGALAGLAQINRWSRGAAIFWPSIARLARESPTRPLRVLDIATGGGDVPIALWRRAQGAGIALEIDGCDFNSQSVAYAQSRARTRGASLQFFPLDVVEGPLPPGYDVFICSLFLHHLSRANAVRLMARMAAAAERMVCINDLVRSRRGLALAYGGAFILTRSRVVHYDAPRSVRAAFALSEVAELAREAGLEGFRIVRRWPCRYLLTWRRA